MAMTPTGLWCLVSGPDYYNALPEELKRNDGLVTWSAPSRLNVGDIAIFYQSSPSKQFKWLFRARSDAIPEPSWGHMGWFEAIEIQNGIGFSEAASDLTIKNNWNKIKAFLVGSNHVVPEIAWERLMKMVIKRNPSISSVIRSWQADIPKPIDRALDEMNPADEYNFIPLFELESEMEESVLSWFTRKNIARLPNRSDGLKITGRQDRINSGIRTDLLMVDKRVRERQLLLLELKLWVQSRANVSQVKSYEEVLEKMYPQWQISSNLIAQGYSDNSLTWAKQSNIICWEISKVGSNKYDIKVKGLA